MKLMIKNMVCNRCIDVIGNILNELQIDITDIRLGEVITRESVPSDKKQMFSDKLKAHGFELIDDRNSQLINNVKSLVIKQIHHSEKHLNINWSEFLSEKLHHEYKSLSKLFSSIEGITIEQYIIRQKIEKVKELIHYDQLSLSEIAYKLDYSSVAHLSGQFKKITGMTPSQFKSVGTRTPLDHL